MRVFISSYRIFTLAIPIEYVSSIFTNAENSEYKIIYNHENKNTYVSLPKLFNCPQAAVRHGIVLKNIGGNNDKMSVMDDSLENKTILLGAAVENESEINCESIYPVPKTLNLMEFFFIFSGMTFNKSGDLVLLLDPNHLLNNIKKELLA